MKTTIHKQEQSSATTIGQRKSGIGFEIMPILLLLVIVCCCWIRSLNNFFLADDIGEVSYVHQIFNGHPQWFLANLTGNYMQIASMSVYRPWLLVTLAIDYLVWKSNPAGYYLSNLLYYSGCTVLIYLICRKLSQKWLSWRSQCASFFAAALFAANPLHAESISWIVGRVDIDCCFYYLLSLYLVLANLTIRKKWLTVAAVASFWLALFTKEMAIGLPVVLTAVGFLLPELRGQHDRSWKSAIASGWNISKYFWFSTLAYFMVRLVALGTLVGGYTGSIGSSQLTSCIAKWLDPDTISRFFFPFNFYIFHGANIYSQALAVCYGIVFMLLVLRAFTLQVAPKWYALFAIWLATCAAPIFQLWGLGYNLEGSRFYFFLTVPAAILISFLLFAQEPEEKTFLGNKQQKLISIVSIASLSLALFIFCRVAYINNTVWLKAGKQVRAVLEEATYLAQTLPANKPILILGLPKDLGGAHMILNGDTFRLLMSPPFTDKSLFDRFLTFEPVLFSPNAQTDATRLKAAIQSNNVSGPFVWNEEQRAFILHRLPKLDKLPAANANIALDFSPSGGHLEAYTLGHADLVADKGGFSLSRLQAGDGILLSGQHTNPMKADFLEMQMSSGKGALPAVTVSWNTDLPNNADNSVTTQEQAVNCIYVPLSRNWHWLLSSDIHDLAVTFSPCDYVHIKSLNLVAAETVSPQIEIEHAQVSNTGISPVNSLPLMLTVQNKLFAAGNCTLEIQIGKRDCFFDNVEANKQDNLVAYKLNFPVTHAQANHIALPASYFAGPGFYQLRARYVGHERTYPWCDSHTLKVNART